MNGRKGSVKTGVVETKHVWSNAPTSSSPVSRARRLEKSSMLTTFLHLRSHDTGDRSIYRWRASDITLRQVERSAVPCDRGLLLLCGDGRRARRRRRGRAPAARQSVQSNVSPLDGSAVSSVSFDASSLPVRSPPSRQRTAVQRYRTVARAPGIPRIPLHIYTCGRCVATTMQTCCLRSAHSGGPGAKRGRY